MSYQFCFAHSSIKGYEATPSGVRILLSFALSVTLLTFSVTTLSASILNPGISILFYDSPGTLSNPGILFPI